MRKLTTEEMEDLRDMITHDGFKALLQEIDNLVRGIQVDVLKFNLDGGDERKLIRLKSRAEGAEQLAKAIELRLKSLKSKTTDG